MKIYNSLSKKVEEFKPVSPDIVTMYTCGPTVYDYVTIGNLRTYVLSDIVYRVLLYNGNKVKHVMNITDVGHLTGDNEGDADFGADRLELAADREGKSAKDIAQFYIRQFSADYEKLGLTEPEKYIKATDSINAMIELIKVLERKGYTYRTTDGIYFNSAKYTDYGKLSGIKPDQVLEGARVPVNKEKKSPTDFALWKYSPEDKMRWQEWDSPWGRGFPGWHIECSAMIMSEFGNTIDIHLGGEDLKMIHHQNEIAQSECATGKKLANYWMHGAFLKVDGGRMGKSKGNAYTVSDVEAKGFLPLSLRYLFLMAHYRTKLNFTWEALQNAENSLKKLYVLVEGYQESKDSQVAYDHLKEFEAAINEDMNMPQALAVMWEMLKSGVPEGSKLRTLEKFDEILGLEITDHIGFEIPQEILSLAKMRWEYRKQGIWDKADMLRRQLEEKGFVVEDRQDEYKIKVKRS